MSVENPTTIEGLYKALSKFIGDKLEGVNGRLHSVEERFACVVSHLSGLEVIV